MASSGSPATLASGPTRERSAGNSAASPASSSLLDLGDVYSIDALGFDTTSGASQVTFPAALFAYVSDDGQTWHYVADLINEAIPQDQYVRHRFVAQGLKTRGRHLAIYVAKGGFYGFVDEIEVMQGHGDPAAVSFAEAGIDQSAIESDALERAEHAVQKNIDLYFVQAARDQVMSMQGADAAAVLRQLEALERVVFTGSGGEEVDYSKGLPHTEVGHRICAAMGTYFSRRDDRAAIIWQPTDSMWSHRTNPFARPITEVAPKLHADMMIGEYEPVAFNVSNNTAEPLNIQVEVGALRGVEGEDGLAGRADHTTYCNPCRGQWIPIFRRRPASPRRRRCDPCHRA